MRLLLLSAGVAAFVTGGSALAPAQVRPGELTKGEVWIQNRGRDQAIPVSVQELAPDQPPLHVRIVAPTWSYRVERVASGTEPTAQLNALGAQGWETTGIVWVSPDGSSHYLMKHER